MITIRYLKNYRFRVKNILRVLLIEACLIVPALFFESTTLAKAFQVESDYCSYSYNFGYELNYETGLPGELIYPQGSINFYKDEYQTQPIIANSVMRKETLKIDSSYDYSLLAKLEKSSDIIVPSNIASKYNLKNGDYLFALYPYSNTPVEMRIICVIKSLYDFSDNAYTNNLGLVIVGYDPLFASLTNHDFVLLSSKSESKSLSDFPQAIRSTFNKQQTLDEAHKSLEFPFLLNVFLSISAIFLFYVLLNKKTISDTKLLFKYNPNKKLMLLMVNVECLCFLCLPSISFIWMAFLFIQTNSMQYFVFSLSFLGIIVFALAFNAIALSLKWRNRKWKK